MVVLVQALSNLAQSTHHPASNITSTASHCGGGSGSGGSVGCGAVVLVID